MRENKIIYNDFAALADKNSIAPSVGSSEYQNSNSLLSGNDRNIINYASFEGRGINLLDPSLVFADEGDSVGYISEAISAQSKDIDVSIVVDLSNGYYSAPGITFHFHKNFCTELSVEWQKDGETVDSADVFPDSLIYYFEKQVDEFNRIILTFKKTETAIQFVKLSGIDLGKTREISQFYGAISTFFEIAPDCSDVPGATCDFEAQISENFIPQSEQEIYLYSAGELIGKFIVDNITPQGSDRYLFECSDEILKLEESDFEALSYGEYTAELIAEKIKAFSNIDIDTAEFSEMILAGFVEADKSSRLAALMLSFGTGAFISSMGKKSLTLLKPRNRTDKLIGANQIIGTPTYRQISSFSIIGLKVFLNSFDTVKEEKSKANPSRKANDKISSQIYDEYSLMSDSEKRFAELLQLGFKQNEIEADILLTDERVGDILSIETKYNGIKTGIVKSMDISFSTLPTAHVVIIERSFTEEEEEQNG